MINTAEQLIDYIAATLKSKVIVKTGPRLIVNVDHQIFSIEVKWEGDTRRELEQG